MKKLLFLMVCSLCGTIANAQTKGDVTGDGRVNDADIDEVVNIIMGDSANPNGDVNEDSRVNIGDIGAIVSIMMTPIPVPVPVPVPSSEFFYSDGIKYSISGDHVSVVSGDYEYQGDITIPERVTYYGVTYRVTSIEGFAFYQCRSLKSVTIPSSVTSIGSSAFEECTGMTSISLSDGLQIIGGSAYESCTALSAITIPNSVNAISLNAFKNCSNLKDVTSEIQTPFAIQDNVFEGIASGATLTVPKGTKSAYQNTAGWNQFNKVIEIGGSDEPTPIPVGAVLLAEKDWTGGFKGDYPMWYQFADGQDGSVSSDPDGVAITVGTQTGELWQPQVQILNEGLTLAEGNSYKVRILAKFPANGILRICMGNWSGYDEYTTDVGATGDFQWVEVEFPDYAYNADYAYNVDGDGFVLFQCGDFKGKTIIKKVQVYDLDGDKQFMVNGIYYKVGENNTISVISGFVKYSGNVVVPNQETHNGKTYSVTSIGRLAFYGCSGLTSVTIPNSVTSIADNAFQECSGLTTVISEIEKPFEIWSYVFSGIPSDAELIVPKGTKAAYQSMAGWNKFTKITEAAEEEVSEFYVDGVCYKIGENNTVSVTSGEVKYSGDVVIPSQVIYNGITYSVTRIGQYAFSGCSNMTSITISNGVTSIDYRAFNGCSGMKSITIPKSLIRIGENAFDDCNSLTAVHIIDLEAWLNVYIEEGSRGSVPCSSSPLCYAHHLYLNGEEVKSIVIPSTETYIGSFYYDGWSGLTSVTIPDGVKSIGEYAFHSCGGLRNVTISNSVTRIGIAAFNGCGSLTSIVSEIKNPFEISDYVFDTDIYSTASLTVPAGTKSLYQNTAGWNKFKNIVEESTDDANFTINGVTYQGTKSSKTVVVKSVDKSMASLEIPASISYDGVDYQVTGIDNDAFKGNSMAALIWNVEAALPNNAFNNASIGSNFLLYVKSSTYAPSSVKNVVVNGTAQTIVLSDDGGQFYCPQTFTARSISYTHNYSMETGGNGKGWETIALPFDVQKITHSTRGEIVPFPAYNSSSNQKPFWLAIFSGSGFRRTAAVLANEPYIIAMPNSTKYQNNYNLAGDVTFSSENIQVPKTPSFSGTFVPSFATVAKSSSVYALNVNNRQVKYTGSYNPGSRFISGLRDIRPFEAYMTGNFTRGIIEIGFDDNTTDMDDILISTDESQEVTIHTLSGQQVARTTQRDFDAVWQQLPKGVYIVRQSGVRPQGGKKMIR